jgi:anti-sigma factor RsiW
MNCELCCENLTAYLDQELETRESERVRQHLDGCAVCRNEVRELREAMLLVDSNTVRIELRPPLWLNVKAQINDAPVAREGWLGALAARWLSLAATGAAALAIGFGLWGYQQRQEAVRQQEARSALELQLYMNNYVHSRQIDEAAHRVVAVPAVARPATATRVVHREYRENPFSSLALHSSSPFGSSLTEEPKPEATR